MGIVKMDKGDTKLIRAMIEDLDGQIETAKNLPMDFVAQLLQMARLELLTHYHGIEKAEFEVFCDAINSPKENRLRRTGGSGTDRLRRLRGERPKTRNTGRSEVPNS